MVKKHSKHAKKRTSPKAKGGGVEWAKSLSKKFHKYVVPKRKAKRTSSTGARIDPKGDK